MHGTQFPPLLVGQPPSLSTDIPVGSMGRRTWLLLTSPFTQWPHPQTTPRDCLPWLRPTMLSLPSLTLFSRAVLRRLRGKEKARVQSWRNWRPGQPREARLLRKGKWPRNHRNPDQETWICLGPEQPPRGGKSQLTRLRATLLS